ncbi:MAG: hypothetical protein QXH27_04720 [Candidatus Micrarchaeia archaeon]
MRELANLAVLLGSLVLYALHVGMSRELGLFVSAVFYFLVAGALAYTSLLAEWALRGKVSALPGALAAVEEGWWLLALPTIALSFAGFSMDVGRARALLWIPEYVVLTAFLGGAALGFRIWGASEGKRHAPRFLWQDSHPAGGVIDHIAFRLHALLGGCAAALALAVAVFAASHALRIPVYAQAWTAMLVSGIAFFSTLLFRIEHLERSALTEEAACNNDVLHDRVESLVPFAEMKEVALQEEAGLAVVTDRLGGKRAFVVYDARGFAEACRRKRLPLVRLGALKAS